MTSGHPPIQARTKNPPLSLNRLPTVTGVLLNFRNKRTFLGNTILALTSGVRDLTPVFPGCYGRVGRGGSMLPSTVGLCHGPCSETRGWGVTWRLRHGSSHHNPSGQTAQILFSLLHHDQTGGCGHFACPPYPARRRPDAVTVFGGAGRVCVGELISISSSRIFVVTPSNRSKQKDITTCD